MTGLCGNVLEPDCTIGSTAVRLHAVCDLVCFCLQFFHLTLIVDSKCSHLWQVQVMGLMMRLL